MIPLVYHFFHDLLWSPERARLWFRSAMGFAAGGAVQLVSVPADTWAKWTAREWVIRVLVASLFSLALATKAGEKNKPEAPKA